MHPLMPWEYPQSMEPNERPWLTDPTRPMDPCPMDPCPACVADEDGALCTEHGRLIVELL
jgi:hypothetical protein